jgi:hypothetical protein
MSEWVETFRAAPPLLALGLPSSQLNLGKRIEELVGQVDWEKAKDPLVDVTHASDATSPLSSFAV